MMVPMDKGANNDGRTGGFSNSPPNNKNMSNGGIGGGIISQNIANAQINAYKATQ